MDIVVPIKLVPDLVEELTINAGGTRLDPTWMRSIISEFDDHAIEQSILLKERIGGTVTVLAQNYEGIDDVLFTAAAKGADRLVKFYTGSEDPINNHALARLLATSIAALQPHLVLTGVQAHDDLDGSLGPLLAGFLGWPYVGYVSGIRVEGGQVAVRKEYPGGLLAEVDVKLPAVLGIQAADKPPRYVAVSKVRQAMKSTSIEEQDALDLDLSDGPIVERLFQPEAGTRATILEGDVDDVVERLVDIFKELGVL